MSEKNFFQRNWRLLAEITGIVLMLFLIFYGQKWKNAYYGTVSSDSLKVIRNIVRQQTIDKELSDRYSDSLEFKLRQEQVDKMLLEDKLKHRKIDIQTQFIQDSTNIGKLKTVKDTMDFLIIDRDKYKRFYSATDSANKTLLSENDTLITWALRCTSELDSCNAGRELLIKLLGDQNEICNKAIKKRKRKEFWNGLRNDLISFTLGYLTGKLR